MILLKAATVALNVAFAGFVTLLVTKAVSAWQNYTQRVENAVKQSQEAVQKANQLKSSLIDLSNSYEELGDKASWDTSDFDQAKDIQEELLELLKDQDGISRDRIDKIDLQNGKYEEQLELLRQIRLEQLQGETSDLVQNKDNQGKLLEKTAKEQAHDNHSVDSFDSEMAKELAGKFGWSYDEDSGVLNFDNYDPDDADSVVKHYNELGQALDIITKKYSDADRATSGLYDAFKNDRAGIKDQVEAYIDYAAKKEHTHTKAQITDFPASLKNPTALTIQTNGAIAATYDGSAAKTVNITKGNIGLGNVDNTADANKSVKYATSAGNASKVNNHTVNIDVPANAKFTDTIYGVATASSNGLMSSTDKTKLDDFSRVISIQKQIKLTTDWQDTGISGNNLETGTYVVQVSGFNASYTQIYSEMYSGVMSWYSGATNSLNSSEIFLHNAGHADNNNAIYLRTMRTAGQGSLKLQIACKAAATGTDTLTFKFRRLI